MYCSHIWVASVSCQLFGWKSGPIFSPVKMPYRMHSNLSTMSRQHRTMQWHIIPAKQTYDVIIIATNIFGKLIIKTAPFIGSPQAIIYQLSNRHRTQYSNYRCRKSLFYCCCLYLPNSTLSFLHKAIILKPVFVPLSNTG